MDNNKFRLWNRISAAAVLIISAFTYLMTIEPTASFWDCGEFIASSYKLEVGHPPGNPVFQLIARFMTIFTDNMHAAVAINAMSALCSAFTIFFLYLTIVFFAKRIVSKREDGSFTTGGAIAIFGSGIVGSLIYCFSDTFWFSAVEAEVYAMSSLFTAIVFWAMTKWYDEADEPHSARWLVLIFFLMGLSIGVHLLNLLALPAIIFMYFYRKREEKGYTFPQLFGILVISALLLGFLVFVFIPYLPKVAAGVDYWFVNSLGLPFNSGAAAFMALLLLLLFAGVFASEKKRKPVLNTVLLCATMLVIGFSLFAVVIIRSAVKTPTNEYQPDNPYTLVRYLNREQYGSAPLIYGPSYAAVMNREFSLESTTYIAPLEDRYIETEGQSDIIYDPGTKMLFPRMWSYADEHVRFYSDNYVQDGVREYKSSQGNVKKYKKPTTVENLAFFLDYQMDWMYWRYFMWNFAGRQNEIHGRSKNPFYGNWESGIGFLDKAMYGDQGDAPDFMKKNKGKNHYFFLPLLLGLIGLVFQFDRDKRGSWLIFLMFFMTGIAIVMYLNQPPYQVRERDYAYAGSFYFFSVWTGFAVAALYEWIAAFVGGKGKKAVAVAVSVACLGVPLLMAAQNWDDHDRSNRRTAVEMARNYLNSAGENGLLISHGDNDTFPLWYAQEVENVRPDVRVINTSLLGTDWHIDQMLWAVNESAPLKFTIPHREYLYGTNESVLVYELEWVKVGRGYRPKYVWEEETVPLRDVIDDFIANKHLISTDYDSDGNPTGFTEMKYLTASKVSIPVNKENVLKYGIVDEKYADMIQDSIVLEIPRRVDKPNLFMLDLLASYEWDRPIDVLAEGGGIFNKPDGINLDDYLMYDGFVWRLVPFKTHNHSYEQVFDIDKVYDQIMDTWSWDALKRTDYFADYQNYYTFLAVINQRGIFAQEAESLLAAGEDEKALKVLEKCLESVPASVFPLETIGLNGMYSNDLHVMNIASLLGECGAEEKARSLMAAFAGEFDKDARFMFRNYQMVDLNTLYYFDYVLMEALDYTLSGNYPCFKDEDALPFVQFLSDHMAEITAFDNRHNPDIIIECVKLLLGCDNEEYYAIGTEIVDFLVKAGEIDQAYSDAIFEYFPPKDNLSTNN